LVIFNISVCTFLKELKRVLAWFDGGEYEIERPPHGLHAEPKSNASAGRSRESLF